MGPTARLLLSPVSALTAINLAIFSRDSPAFSGTGSLSGSAGSPPSGSECSWREPGAFQGGRRGRRK